MNRMGYPLGRRALRLYFVGLLTLYVASLWLTTYRRSESLAHFDRGAQWNLRSWRGRIWAEWSRETLFIPTPTGWYLPAIDSTITTSPDPMYFTSLLGFSSGAYPPSGLGPHVIHVTSVPHWVLFCTGLATTVMLLMPAFKAAIAARRGLCPVCGYDVRVTPNRCSECGYVRDSECRRVRPRSTKIHGNQNH